MSYFTIFICKITIQIVLNRFRIYKKMMKMINYLFNFEKFVLNEALFDQSLNEYLR
jgi:hypothetical protein